MVNSYEKELAMFCERIAEWLNRKIDIPNVPEFMEKIIFNQAVKWISNQILNCLKKVGRKNV